MKGGSIAPLFYGVRMSDNTPFKSNEQMFITGVNRLWTTEDIFSLE